MKNAVLLFLLLCVHSTWAQNDKILYRADKYFEIRNYREALKLYLEAIELKEKNPQAFYKAGICYLNFPDVDEQLKAIPYLEFASNNRDQSIPGEIDNYLGDVYHKNLQTELAIQYLEAYRKTLQDTKKIGEIDYKLQQCYNTQLHLSKAKSNIIIKNLGEKINTEFTDYNPVVATDESVMAFTSLRPANGNSGALMEAIYITSKSGGNWIGPAKAEIKTQYNVGTAGMSPDGQQMLIFIGGANNTGNLYMTNRESNGWSTPSILGNTINSNYLESTASITPDGRTIYFASNRPGGHGGMDVYKVVKESKGNWGYPVNLGPGINTKYDDDAPFIHPDQRTLFFTSSGHNSMGGKDIFRSTFNAGKWSNPENLGFPINTPANDNYFTLTADGRKGYFSSDRKGGYGGQDIYTFDMPEEEANIALTLIKGKIIEGETKKPIPTQIKVVDKETNKFIDYVYNPDKNTGNYLIIFPPGKNYDMIIESEGYMPYTLNINIPNQTYFYELYQEITLNAIRQFDIVVGQEVSVKNIFTDVNGDRQEKVSVRKVNEAMLVQNDSLDLYDLMDAIISSEDEVAFEYLLELMFSVNPVSDVDFTKVSEDNLESARRTYYYDESDTTTLEITEIEGQKIVSLPTLFVAEESRKMKAEKNTPTAAFYDPKLLDPVIKVYFDANQSRNWRMF